MKDKYKTKKQLINELIEMRQRITELETLEAEHKRAQKELCKITRALKVLSECNEVVIRAKEESDLLHNICKIIVEVGGYRLAWIGLAEQDEKKTVRPVAQAGYEEGYLDTTNITWADTERGRGPTGVAIRTGKPSINRNVLKNPDYAPWRAEAIKRGYQSSIALPLIAGDQTLGALNIYAAEPDAFDAEEVRLLTELANDMAYGIMTLRTRAERKRMEEEQARLQRRLEALWKTARMVNADYQTLCNHVLVEIVAMTQSRYGFYGFLNEDESVMTLYSWSKEAMKDCQIQDKSIEYPIVKAGLWGDAVRKRRILIINDYQADHPSKRGLPKGHVPLTRILVVPIFSNSRIVALAAVANKPTQYTEEDAEQINAFVTSAQTILEKRQAEEALKEAEQRYRELVEGLDAIVWEADAQTWQFTFVSKRAEAILGYPVNQWLSEPNFWIDHIHPDDRNEAVSFCQLYTQKGRDHEFEYRMIAADGSVVWLRDVVTVECAEGKPVRLKGVMIDITPLKKAEEEKEKIQAQLLQAQKMEAIGRLAGGVAHDFNNLLTTIQGYTDLIMMKIDEMNPLYKDLEQIHLAAVRAGSLTRQLLLFSRRQPMELVPLDINKTIDDLLKMLSRLIGEDITISTDMEPDLWTVRADAGNIEQVIMNLAVNARDAMPKGGRLIIRTENVIMDEEHCKVIPEARPGKFVCLSIEDTGVGMDKEIIQRIFEPFFSTKEAGKGTGLGLSVVYGIVKQHKGWINVYSEPGQGSIFKVYLPAFSIKLKSETKKTISIQELQGRGERILLVEDEEGVRELATKVLYENGYVVFEAANAKEAMDIFDREKGEFHLVFCDEVLPDKSGLQLIDQLLSRKPELRILLSSGYTDQKLQWSVIRERGFRFLQKPYTLPDLLRAIKEAIKSG
jgi:PAS domain S-box-containing protein